MKHVILGFLIGVAIAVLAFVAGMEYGSKPDIVRDRFTIYGESYDVITFDNSSYISYWN